MPGTPLAHGIEIADRAGHLAPTEQVHSFQPGDLRYKLGQGLEPGIFELREAAGATSKPRKLSGSYPGAQSSRLCEEELVPHLDAIVIHCRQPAALAGFYAEVLSLPIAPADVAAIEAGTLGPDESVLLGSRDALHVWLTPVRTLEPVPGRVHLDVRLDVAGDLDRLIVLGATRQWEDPKGRWTVLADPEGNLFCAMYPAI
jgi:hypothetical protein